MNILESDQSSNDRHTRKRRPKVLSFYAETIEQFPPEAAEAGTLVIKTHIPSPSLQFLARFFGGTLIITVREPRDAIASLMQRFEHDFSACVQEVSAGAACLVNLARMGRPLVLRYEDRFYDRSQTVARVASRLGIKVPPAVGREIYDSLRPECVRSKIDRLQKAGAFGRPASADSFDARTHWHPGHIGDLRIGKYRDALSTKMQRIVLRAMREYCIVFGYSVTAREGARGRSRDHGGSGIRNYNGLRYLQKA